MQITVLGCVSAISQVIPTMVVFSGKNFNHIHSEGKVLGAFSGMSDSGWMDQELWFSCHFLKHAGSSRPLMLILDGHSSHFTLDVAQTAAEHQVVIFRPPPHTMADSQLLDTSCFGPLKTYWSQGVVTTCLLILVESSQSLSSPTSLLKHGQRGLSSITSLPVSEIPEFIHSILPNKILNQDSSVQEQFSSEPIRLFKERFANGYDIYTDHKYVAWLEQFHPKSLLTFVNGFLDSPHTTVYAIDPFTAYNTGKYL